MGLGARARSHPYLHLCPCLHPHPYPPPVHLQITVPGEYIEDTIGKVKYCRNIQVPTLWGLSSEWVRGGVTEQDYVALLYTGYEGPTPFIGV